MADAMREKVARKMFKQDHDEPWAQGEARTKLIYLNNARAALEACHFEEGRTIAALIVRAVNHHEELVEALEDIATYWNRNHNKIAMSDACHHNADLARQVLAKVKDEGHG